jgi:PAS domain S-box-containing protein
VVSGGVQTLINGLTAENIDSIMESISDAILAIDLEGTCVYISPSHRHILGTGEEILGRNSFDFVHPDDLGQVLEKYAHALANFTEAVCEYRFLHPERGPIWVESRGRYATYSHGTPLIVIVTREVGERREAEAALRESKLFVERIAAASPFILYVFDIIAQENVYVNRKLEEDLGYSHEAIEEMGAGMMMQLLHPEDQARLPALLARWHDAPDGEVLDTEYRMRNAAGEWRWFLGRDTVFQRATDGKVIKIIGTAMDITERKYAEMERIQAAEERRQLLEQMWHVQKLESLGVLAGGIAHDFNNILTAMLGHAQLARMKMPADSRAVANIDEVEAAARRAADLCKQMLAYSGKGQFVSRALDLGKVVEGMVQMLEVAVSKKAALRLALSPGLPAIEADQAQIEQVILNLIVNASEALEGRDGDIHVSTGAIVHEPNTAWDTYPASVAAGQACVYIEVTDTGCGMDAATRARVFDPFFSTKFTGRGLGLAAVMGIVRGHGGTIQVRSAPGSGAAFRVLLPASEKTADTPVHVGTPAPAPQGATVLLVDDEDAVRNATSESLAALGYNVITAIHGGEALDVFRVRHTEIAVVLLDLTMPVMDGEEAFYALREVNPKVPVLLASGFHRNDVIEQLSQLGLAGFVQKPYSINALASALANALAAK